MSGLWTPNGDVNPQDNSQNQQAQEPQNPQADDPFAGMSEEEKQAAMEQITQMRQELLGTPARDVIGNHIVGFYELASVHLSEAAQAQGGERENRLNEATLCIDAMEAVVKELGDRLDQHAEPLNAALSQMQMAYTQVKSGANESE